MRPRVVIIGGGLAGLAAASALSGRMDVMLLESRPRWGGRASSFLDRRTGETIDNCQHVSMGCCTNFDHFCREMGIDASLETQDALYFVGPDAAIHRFAAGFLPAPFHLFPAFRKLSYLRRAQLREIQAGLKALGRESNPHPEESFADWLHRHGQSEETIANFWQVVLVSALSESLDRIDVGHARKVFVDGFLAHRDGWKVRIPTVPLTELYGGKLAERFAERRVNLRLQAGVKRLHLQHGRIASAELRSGERLQADHFILAVPHHAVCSLLPERIAEDPFFSGVEQLESAPISSVHLWFDREITPLPHAVFVGRLSQWMFHRTALQQRSGGERADGSQIGRYYQVVISASRELAEESQSGTISRVVSELADVWPVAGEAELLHARLLTEHKAVFSPLPGVDDLRPPQQSPVANLQIAGDWTATGWPSTMEGAVRSGYLAAENVLEQMGTPQRIVQPDLPTAVLSKWLLGL